MNDRFGFPDDETHTKIRLRNPSPIAGTLLSMSIEYAKTPLNIHWVSSTKTLPVSKYPVDYSANLCL